MSNQEPTRRIAWDDEIDVPRRPHIYRVICPRPREPHCVGVVLAHQWRRVYTHYLPSLDLPGKGRPAPHWEPASCCEGCTAHNQRPREKWYAPVYLPATSRIVLFEATEGAKEYEPRISDKGFDWRGWLIRLYRVGNDKRSRMGVELTRKSDIPIPEAPPLEPSFEVLWGMRANTLPPIDERAAKKGGVA
jgi:hypothetical protein